MRRRTKIVATLGPATDAPGRIEELVLAGMNVARINTSHSGHDEHRRRIDAVRAAAEATGREVAILVDLQGPKIRIEGFADGPVHLDDGARFSLDTALAPDAGSVERVGISYPELVDDVSPGDALLLNDGVIRLEVEAIEGTAVHCRVVSGGWLSDRKGINRLGGGLSADALTAKDREDVRFAADVGADFIAVSFPRSAKDIETARALCEAHGLDAHLIAKIERAEAVDDLEAITEASDGVMVARGDLGVEIGDAELPAVQKRLIALARDLNRVVITATQMMESMINQPIPTRAEVLDVANAVMDGTDAVMLSAETAAGKYPVKAIEAMVRVCLGAEKHLVATRRRSTAQDHFARTDEAIAMATMYTARHMHAQAIISLTESGATARMMSRQDIGIPIFALTRFETTRRRMCLCRGVYPVQFDATNLDSSLKPIREAINCLLDRELIVEGDRVLITKGDFTGPGGTNALKIVTVGEY
ncbi:pyruvate kinase [uncultured Abyssibacter sp.]|uniref:pyruvate kinase n=1 Tax=uncultured Abyssibacter sp. TaxID=2320202 RepID=UPI0032B0FA24